MIYISVDFKGRAHLADSEILDDYKDGVIDNGGALLRIDGESVSQYTCDPDPDFEWQELF